METTKLSEEQKEVIKEIIVLEVEGAKGQKWTHARLKTLASLYKKIGFENDFF